MNILYIALTLTIFNFGLHSITRENGFLSFLGRFTTDKKGNIRSEMLNPFIDCYPCMSSFWTIIYLYYASYLDYWDLLLFLAFFLAIAMIDYVINCYQGCKFVYLLLLCCLLELSGVAVEGFLIMMTTYAMSYSFCMLYEKAIADNA